jgi:hypothetical protein
MLLRSCPERRYLLLVISITGVISVGVDNLEPVLHQAEEFAERFHQRVMLLFARLAVGVSAAFLLNFLMAGSIFACCSSIRMRCGSAHTFAATNALLGLLLTSLIRVYDAAGNVIETHDHKGDFKEW